MNNELNFKRIMKAIKNKDTKELIRLTDDMDSFNDYQYETTVEYAYDQGVLGIIDPDLERALIYNRIDQQILKEL